MMGTGVAVATGFGGAVGRIIGVDDGGTAGASAVIRSTRGDASDAVGGVDALGVSVGVGVGESAGEAEGDGEAEGSSVGEGEGEGRGVCGGISVAIAIGRGVAWASGVTTGGAVVACDVAAAPLVARC